MEISGRQVLVTGAGGFIGSHLVEALLSRECRVRALVRYNSRNHWGFLEECAAAEPRLEVVLGNVEDSFLVDRVVEGCEVVFHLAALIAVPYSYVAPESYVATNVSGTLNVLEACRRHATPRLVHTSTSETYGTAQYSPIDERHPLQGQSPYAASKIGADKLAEAYWRSYEVPVVTLRPFNAFGPRQSARAVLPTIITQALDGNQVRLGALSPVRDLTFVEDTVRAFVAAAEADQAVGRVVNAGTGRGISVGSLASRVLRHLGREATCPIVEDRARVRPARSEVFELVCDNTLAREILGWTPQVSLDEGIDRTVAYIRSHLDQYKSGSYVV